MVGVPFDCFANPLGAVRLTFEKATGAGADPASLNGKDWGLVDLFRSQGDFSQIPILDHRSIGWIQPNSLVRFRGMVQDMLGNEFYVGAFQDGSTWRTNKFTDVAAFPMVSQSEPIIWERQLVYCVPVPGQNSWTVQPSSQSIFNRCNNRAFQHGEKRERETDGSADDVVMVNQEFQASTSSVKKMREDGVPGPSPQVQASVIGEPSSRVNVLPEFDSKCLPCLVKIYDSPETNLKLNDIVEFVGVFTFNPELIPEVDGSGDLSNELFEDTLAHFPPNKVPRLHCIIHRKLASHDFLVNTPVIETTPSFIRGIREGLLGHLTAVLGNDGLAAECVLLHLLSRIHTRIDSSAVGKLSLNLTGFTCEILPVFGGQLKNVIQTLLPFTKLIPLSVEYLNTASLSPKKDYEMNRLVSGTLQLAEGTHLTIDETQLKPGMLNSVGVENTRLLNSLMELQKMEYDFKFYKMEMLADVQFLVLSEGKSNILPADVVLPFQPSVLDSSARAGTEALQAWRWYLATLRSSTHDINPEMQKVIEDDLVAARQEDRTLGSNDFHRWLTMARLMSASFGETHLTLEHWQLVKEIERRRKERVRLVEMKNRAGQ